MWLNARLHRVFSNMFRFVFYYIVSFILLHVYGMFDVTECFNTKIDSKLIHINIHGNNV